MGLRQTSLEAYQDVRAHLGERQAAVIEALRQQETCTDQQLALMLGWSINRITPRRGELVKLGLVEAAGVVRQNGRSATLWKVRRCRHRQE